MNGRMAMRAADMKNAARHLLPIAVLLVSACERGPIHHEDNHDRLLQKVLARVPIGTNIARAREVMEAEGLTCLSPAYVGKDKVAMRCDGLYQESGVERLWSIGFFESEKRVRSVIIQLRILNS